MTSRLVSERGIEMIITGGIHVSKMGNTQAGGKE